MVAKMRNLGSACTAANRFYVHEAVHDAFAAKLAARMGAMRVGNPLDEGVEVGSLVNQETFAKDGAFVDDAVAKGARVLTGGRPPGGPGWFYPPTVLVEVPDTASCLGDEIFGTENGRAHGRPALPNAHLVRNAMLEHKSELNI